MFHGAPASPQRRPTHPLAAINERHAARRRLSGAPEGRPRCYRSAAPMGLVLATTFGLVLWLVLWATGTKAFDAFMLTALIMLVAATVRMIAPYLPGNRRT